jgi:hypothetical protein
MLYDLCNVQPGIGAGCRARKRHDRDWNRVGDTRGDLDPELRPRREHGTAGQDGARNV